MHWNWSLLFVPLCSHLSHVHRMVSISVFAVDIDLAEGTAIPEDFDCVEYAVEEGMIEDTPVQRAAITKAVVRAQFKIVASGTKKIS